MPTRARSSTTSSFGSKMSSPSSRMVPVIRQLSMMSFIRLRQRRNVDFPQPDGPTRASTSFEPMSMLTCSIPIFSPYQTVTSRTVMRAVGEWISPTVSWVSAGSASSARSGTKAVAAEAATVLM